MTARPGRRRRCFAIATAAAFGLVLQSGTATFAAWNDVEWASAPATLGTVDCTDPAGAFASRGEGRMLSGSALGLDTGTAAQVTSVLVTNDGERVLVRPSTASPVTAPPLTDAYADPLNLALLNGSVPIDGTGLLQLPLSTPTGLIRQFGQALSTGDSAGASGYLTDGGAINTSGENAGYPSLATLKLSQLLNTVGYDLGAVLSDATLDVALEIGAVAGRASLESSCAAIWAGTPRSALTRDYLAAGVSTRIDSALVDALGTTVTGTVTGLQTAADGLIGQTGLLSTVTTPVVATVGTVLNTLGFLTGTRVKPGSSSSAITAIVLDLAPVNALITEPVSDPDGVLSISLGQGTVRIDTAALLGQAYDGPHGDRLNGLPPNFDPLTQTGALDALAEALDAALQGWIGRVNTALTTALDNAAVRVQVLLPVEKCSLLGIAGACIGTWKDAGAIGITLDGTVRGLLNGDVTITADLSGLQLGLAGNLLAQLTSALVNGLLQDGLGPIIGGVVDTALRPISQVPLTAADPLIALVTGVYTSLYLSGTVVITVNAQNEPMSGSPPGPSDWNGFPAGRYDVAALRIGLLDAANPLATQLYLGRGSVGATCMLGEAATSCPGY